MTAPRSPRIVAPLLLALRDCLCSQLATSHGGPVCRCMVTHNAVTPTMEGCDCQCEPDGHGDAWTRLVRLEPDSGDVGLANPACTGWIATIELGVYRCVPVSEDADPLPGAQMTGIALDAQADMEALLRVQSCCPALHDHDTATDFWLPLGPLGGCAGGLLQFRVALSDPGGC